jgi:hypothetical protein
MYFRSEYNQVKLFMSIRGKIFGAKGMRSQQLDRAGETCKAQLSLVYPFFCPYIGEKLPRTALAGYKQRELLQSKLRETKSGIQNSKSVQGKRYARQSSAERSSAVNRRREYHCTRQHLHSARETGAF